MADIFSKDKRSEIMSKIHATDTKPEIKVRHYLYKKGYRYRKNYRKLPGSPDIYLSKYNTAIFINGCFWHGHEDCEYFKLPKSNVKFWKDKIYRNKERDQEKIFKLNEIGIFTVTLWECEINYDFERLMSDLENNLIENHHKEKTKMKYDYDSSCKESILKYSKQIENKTLRQVIQEPPSKYNTKNKGALGHAIERDFFGYDINSKKEADFNEAGIELKVVPINKIRKNQKSAQLIKQLGFSAKERIILSKINYNNIVTETWETTELHHKLDSLLLMFYMYEKDVNIYDLMFLLSELWEPFENDVVYLMRDWELIKSKVLAGKAHEISEGDTLLLGACTKGVNKGDTISQPMSSEKAMQRAYSLKRSYVDHIFNTLFSENISKKSKIIPLDVYDRIIAEFAKIQYENLNILSRKYSISVNRDAKQFLYMFTSKLFENLMGMTAEEFNKNNISQIEIKTVLLKSNNVPKESMSFEQIKFDEIIEDDWFESEFRSKFENKKLLWVIFKTNRSYTKQKELDLKDINFIDIFYWNMPNEDLDTDVKALWYDTVDKIRNNDFDNFKKISETRVAHIRPKAVNSDDTMLLKSGAVAPKKSFWLNSQYVADQVRKELTRKGNRLY